MEMGFDDFVTFYNAYKGDTAQANAIRAINTIIPDAINDMVHYVAYKQYDVPLNPEWADLCDESIYNSQSARLRIGPFLMTVWSESAAYVEYLTDEQMMQDRLALGEDDEFYRADSGFMPVSWDSRIVITSFGEVIPRGAAGDEYINALREGRLNDAVMQMLTIMRKEVIDWSRA
jgi:hypothetical protein